MSIHVTVLSIDDSESTGAETNVFAKDEVRIGRSAENDLVLPHSGVSKEHVLIRTQGSNGSTRLLIKDMGSTNGTLVGGRKLNPGQEYELSERERVMIASYVFKVRVHDEPQWKNESPAEEVSPSNGSYVTQVQTPVEHMTTEYGKTTETLDLTSLAEELRSLETAETEVVESSEEVLVIDGTTDTEDIRVDLAAVKLLAVKGVVLHRGKPLPGVEIREPRMGSLFSGEDGSFILSKIPEDESLELVFFKTGYRLTPDSKHLALLSEDISLEVEATKLVTIRGQVVHKGKPLAEVKVSAGVFGETITDESGFYEFANVPEGTPYRLEITKPGFALSKAPNA